jgi:hypothetical protein
MNWQRWGIVAAIVAAVAAVWALLRNPNQPTVNNSPNPSGAGVVPSSQTGIAPQTYTVNPPVLTPSPIVSLAGPAAPYSNATADQGAPNQANLYLTYNLGPGSALGKGKPKTPAPAVMKPEGSCGCETACAVPCKNNAQAVTEGQGAQCMATSRKKQIDALEAKYPGLWDRMKENLYEAGVDPGDVLVYWQQRDNPTMPSNTTVGTSKPAAPGAGDSSTAGNSRNWAGAVWTGIIGHA